MFIPINHLLSLKKCALFPHMSTTLQSSPGLMLAVMLPPVDEWKSVKLLSGKHFILLVHVRLGTYILTRLSSFIPYF